MYIRLYAYVNYRCFFFIGRPKMSNVFGDKRTKLNEVIQSKVWSIHVLDYIYSVYIDIGGLRSKLAVSC